MGLFGGKNHHELAVQWLTHLTAQLYEMTTSSDEVAPFLRFELPDSRFRYMLFCLSDVHVACCGCMKNPDAVLNEVASIVLNYCYEDYQTFFGEKPDGQDAANRVGSHVQDFLHRWSAYVDILSGGNWQAGLGLVVGMIHDCESTNDLQSSDTERLLFVASWILERNPDAEKIFRKNT